VGVRVKSKCERKGGCINNNLEILASRERYDQSVVKQLGSVSVRTYDV
jgi:hypothetical protein